MNCTRARPAFTAGLTALVLCLPVASLAAQNKSNTKKQHRSPVNRRLTRGEYVARQALSFRGVPYRFGGESRNGVDCSGLTQTVWKKYGLYLPRTSVEQFKTGLPVTKSRMVPGDLVFFKNTYRQGISHVGIYVGNGKFVHAANSRKGVVVTSLSTPYYQKHWAGARRVSLEKLPASKKS